MLPKFVTFSMNNNFHNTIVITMVVKDTNTKMAEPFIEKGAKVYKLERINVRQPHRPSNHTATNVLPT